MSRGDSGFMWLSVGMISTVFGLGLAVSGLPLGWLAIVGGISTGAAGALNAGGPSNRIAAPRLPPVPPPRQVPMRAERAKVAAQRKR